MKVYHGTFLYNGGESQYTLTVTAQSAFQAFFLLTADAIRSGSPYQLHEIRYMPDHPEDETPNITGEEFETIAVGDIVSVVSLLKPK